MSTLKTTLKIESVDLFPTPVNFTTITLHSLLGSFAGFQKIKVTDTQTKLNIAPIDGVSLSGLVYLQNVSLTAGVIYIGRGGLEEPFIKLEMGEIALFPYGGLTATGDLFAYIPSVVAPDVLVPLDLNFFIGERD